MNKEVKSNEQDDIDIDKTVLYKYENCFVVCTDTSSRFVVSKM